MASGAMPTLENFGKEMTVSIAGSVVDDIGRIVSKAGITLLASQVVIAVATSDDNGEFSFPDQAVKVGFYVIRAALPNYEPVDETLTLIWEMNNTSVDILLRIIPHNKPFVKIDRRTAEMEERKAQGYEEVGGGGGASLSLPEPPVDKAKYFHVRVLFATDRNRTVFTDPKKRFGNDWADNEVISFGACDVQLPNERKVGDEARPRWYQWREDPNEHIILKSCEDLDATHFYREASQRGPSVLFFIHGYCVTFAESIYRTAQIVDDIKFEGAPICYSWPSKGHFWGYTADEESIIWTRPHLYDVLRATMKLMGVKTINIIAHSMGNRAVIECLDSLAQELSGTKKVNQVKQVVFAAPDVNTGIFRQHLDKIKDSAKRFTLYASSHDKPLKWSKFFSSWDRAGQGGEKLVLHPNLDSIDASTVSCGVLDHSYYGSSWSVLGDIHELLSFDKAPPRFATRGPKDNGNGPFWEIRT
jgi:esterase/lipase superfamily enzyme